MVHERRRVALAADARDISLHPATKGNSAMDIHRRGVLSFQAEGACLLTIVNTMQAEIAHAEEMENYSDKFHRRGAC